MSRRPIVIGISGPSGSGKSTLSARLAEALPHTVIVNADKYYKKELPKIVSPLDGEEYPDWNHPTSIDADGMCAELDALCKRDDLDFIIADGAFIFCIDAVRERLDYKIFVWAEIETRIFRRICRNITLKGQTPEFIGGYYLACVRYREAEYSIPSQKWADVTVNNERDFGDMPEKLTETLLAMRCK